MIPTGQPEFFVTKSRVNEQRDCWKQGPRPTRRARLEQLLRGGPRFSDRLLRWSPDPTGGIWNATQETELPG